MKLPPHFATAQYKLQSVVVNFPVTYLSSVSRK